MPAIDLDMWRRFRENGDCSARDWLVERHLPLAHKIAWRLARHVRDEALVEDLFSAGSVGLIQAVERFDPSRGWRFSTFAYRRIWGAMVDHLRTEADQSRLSRRTARQLDSARNRLEHHLGRSAAQAEVASAMGMASSTFQEWRIEGDRNVVPLTPRMAETTANAPAASGSADTPEWLDRALQLLPPREGAVIRLSYFEDLPNKEIAVVMGVSESRVSQMRTRALSRLRLAGSNARAA